LGFAMLLASADSANFQLAVAAAIDMPSSCVPADAVLLSIVGGESVELRPLQFDRVASLRCLLRRVVSLCYNHTDAYGTCVRATQPAVVSREERYHAMTWMKWHLLRVALRTARTAFFVDADVLLLGNPFAHESVARFATEQPRPAQLLLHQFEGPGSNPLNGGQICSSSWNEAEAIRTVLSDEPSSYDSATQRLDQEIAYSALTRRGVPTAELPRAFAGNCWYGPEVVPWCQLVTFHAHCTGSLTEKITRMRLVLRETEARCASAGRGSGSRVRGLLARRRMLESRTDA
jgi:hypothetical protein